MECVMLFRTELDNGVVLAYGPDTRGKVRLEYPGGQRVETTWRRIAQLEALVAQLAEAYENLLSVTRCERRCPYLNVDLLSRLDHAINRPGDPPARESPEQWQA
jgi:hypothetical protein